MFSNQVSNHVFIMYALQVHFWAPKKHLLFFGLLVMLTDFAKGHAQAAESAGDKREFYQILWLGSWPLKLIESYLVHQKRKSKELEDIFWKMARLFFSLSGTHHQDFVWFVEFGMNFWVFGPILSPWPKRCRRSSNGPMRGHSPAMVSSAQAQVLASATAFGIFAAIALILRKRGGYAVVFWMADVGCWLNVVLFLWVGLS